MFSSNSCPPYFSFLVYKPKSATLLVLTYIYTAYIAVSQSLMDIYLQGHTLALEIGGSDQSDALSDDLMPLGICTHLQMWHVGGKICLDRLENIDQLLMFIRKKASAGDVSMALTSEININVWANSSICIYVISCVKNTYGRLYQVFGYPHPLIYRASSKADLWSMNLYRHFYKRIIITFSMTELNIKSHNIYVALSYP